MRLLTVACLCVLSSMSLHAQGLDDPARVVSRQLEESTELAGQWLESREPRVRAWGAYVATRDHNVGLIPRLLELAIEYAGNRSQAAPTQDEHESMLSVLDALIQLDGRMPRREAASLYAEFPAPALVFLSRGDEASDEFLLRIFRDETRATGAWVTAGNLLMARTPPGFAALVLGGLTVDLDIRIVEPGTRAAPLRGTGTSCSTGAGAPRTDWPAVATYYVSQRGTLLSQGTVPTFYVRIVGMPESSGPGPDFRCDFQTVTRDRVREAWLARLAMESPDAPTVRSHVSETVTWRTDAQYQQELRAAISRQQARLATLAMKLQQSGVLTAQERASARPSIAVAITDARRIVTKELPALAGAGSQVTFKPIVRESAAN